MGKTVKNDYRAYGYFCFVSGIILVGMAPAALGAIWGAVTTWWAGLSPGVILALKMYIITLVLEEGARHIVRSLSEDEAG